MQEYQIRYIENLKQIASLNDIYSHELTGFEEWYQKQIQAREQAAQLKKENIALLNDHFFPVLDDLHNASKQDIAELEEFSDKLMDWTTNLDCGIYLLIHDSLLSLYRFRKDRNGIIRELYKLGMGMYYQQRTVEGFDTKRIRKYRFENEMVFTEAGSYLKYFEEIDDEQTQGFIIRSLANIAITAVDRRKRVAISSRILKILQDENYRSIAPGLPWDVFLRRSYQQMSANRDTLSRGNLSKEELTEILEACQIVFEPEKDNDNPNVRWLWPYYEMEYSCGFADLQTTLGRMEQLIADSKYDQFGDSGFYANVQLPIYYGRLMRDNPSLQNKPKHVEFLHDAYEKMMKTLMSYPPERYNDYFRYNVALVVTGYLEIEGVDTYEEVTTKLMRKLTGISYIRSLRVSEILRAFCDCIYSQEADFFDDIPFLKEIKDPEVKRNTLLDYAGKCGLYYNFGMLSMNMERLRNNRNLFESEYDMYQLHTSGGYDNLISRESTKRYADIAHGHHRWYNEAGGFPEDYVRNESDYRKMCDVTALAVYMTDHREEDYDQLLDQIQKGEGKQFSPLVSSYLHVEELKEEIHTILKKEEREYYRQLYSQLKQ